MGRAIGLGPWFNIPWRLRTTISRNAPIESMTQSATSTFSKREKIVAIKGPATDTARLLKTTGALIIPNARIPPAIKLKGNNCHDNAHWCKKAVSLNRSVKIHKLQFQDEKDQSLSKLSSSFL